MKDREYLDFIRGCFCSVCCLRTVIYGWSGRFPEEKIDGKIQGIEAAHVGDRGLGQKCSDREAIPLCPTHHRIGTDSHHRLGKKFWEHHGLDRDMLIQQYNAAYEAQR